MLKACSHRRDQRTITDITKSTGIGLNKKYNQCYKVITKCNSCDWQFCTFLYEGADIANIEIGDPYYGGQALSL